MPTTRRKKPLYKKFIRLKVNPLNNNRIFFFKKEKWSKLKNSLEKNKKFFKKFKPYSNDNYHLSKFASTGNSFKKRFRNSLLLKKTFSYYHGNLLRQYFKKQITKIYRLKHFKNTMAKSICYFENRLDSVLYKSKFSISIFEARQLITHKHIKVNNRIERNRSYILKPGDVIQINSNSKHFIINNLKKQLMSNNSFNINRLDFILHSCRLDYRHSLKIVQDFITKGYIKINQKIEKNKYYILKPHDKIQVSYPVDRYFVRQLLNKIKVPKALYFFWPLPPSYYIINYNTLEIIIGDNVNFNFSTTFPFKLNIDLILNDYYRH